MARMARLVVPQHPHHVAQRVFFADDDCRADLGLVGDACRAARVCREQFSG